MNVCLNYIIFIALSYLIVLAITLSKEYVKLALFFRSRVYLLVLTLMQPYEGKGAKFYVLNGYKKTREIIF